MVGFSQTVFSLLVVLTIVVFVHEFGHYWVARRAGVRVEVFSVGFGREIFGRTDRLGTRWKFSMIPIGGYVKMFGQNDIGPDGKGYEFTEAERQVSFLHKRLGQRAAIVAAGPIANFVLAILIFWVMFMTVGQPSTPARIVSVIDGSPAAAAGMQPGDLIVELQGKSVERFEEVQQEVRLRPGIEIDLVVERDGRRVPITVTPSIIIEPDARGEVLRYGRLGITGVGRVFVRHGPLQATRQAFRETGRMISVTGTAIGQMITGKRSASELGGPIRIGQVSKDAALAGLVPFIAIIAILSINLGLINLVPVPMLDGGHLLFYAFEAVLGRPLSERTQDFGLKIGLFLVLGLMLFATFNDILRFSFVQQIVGLIS